MKKIYIVPTTLSIELRATKMMALSLNKDESTEITKDNFESDFEGQDSRSYNDSNRGNIWDNAW